LNPVERAKTPSPPILRSKIPLFSIFHFRSDAFRRASQSVRKIGAKIENGKSIIEEFEIRTLPDIDSI
ncbi:MAG: hypothetical protein KF865_09665, partial [Bdellovibrionaceae bacterium]|nr:hypothetical protein [Pseudobdellovibrionaceae bacterium]